MKKKYSYRFKTEAEFIKEFGYSWRKYVTYSFPYKMDHLLGQEYPHLITEDKSIYPSISLCEIPKCNDGQSDMGFWLISRDMVIKNEPNVPNYKPRRKKNK